VHCADLAMCAFSFVCSAAMVTVPIRLTFSVDDEKKPKGPRHSSSESSSEESDASEESLPDLEKEMKEQILKRGAPTGDSHV